MYKYDAMFATFPRSAAKEDIDALQSYKLADVDLNQADYDGRTALHVVRARFRFTNRESTYV